MAGSVQRPVQELVRQSFSVPATAGSYAPERLTFGEVGVGQARRMYQRVTASVDTTIATMIVELWLGRVDATVGSVIDGDYKYSAQTVNSAGATGATTFELAGWPLVQFRVKSGGTGGTAVVSGSAT